MRNYSRLNVKDYDLSKVQDAIENYVTQLYGNPILDGSALYDISLDSSKTNLVPHKLGRKWSFWFLINKNANSEVWVDESASNQDLYLALKSSANVKISLFVG